MVEGDTGTLALVEEVAVLAGVGRGGVVGGLGSVGMTGSVVLGSFGVVTDLGFVSIGLFPSLEATV